MGSSEAEGGVSGAHAPRGPALRGVPCLRKPKGWGPWEAHGVRDCDFRFPCPWMLSWPRRQWTLDSHHCPGLAPEPKLGGDKRWLREGQGQEKEKGWGEKKTTPRHREQGGGHQREGGGGRWERVKGGQR